MYLEATTPTSKKIAALTLFALLYFIGIPLGNAFLTAPGYSSAFWPNSGLFLAALVLTGYRLWPAILLIAVGAETAGHVVAAYSGLSGNQTILMGAIYGVINALDAFTAAFLLRYHWPSPLDLTRLKDLLGLVLLGMGIGSALGATLGAEFLTGVLYPGTAYGDAWQSWFLSDGLGLVIVAPALLSWIGPNRQKLRRPSWAWSLEFALLIISLIIVAQLVFAPDTVSHTLVFYFPFALYPVLIWTAVRFSHRTVTVVLLIMATLLSQEVLLGIGPFFIIAQAGQIIILLLQAFLMVTVISTLALSAVITERKQAETTLRRYADRLEVLHDIDQAILGGRSPQAIAQTAVDHLRRLVAVRQAGVVEFDEVTNQATLLAAGADHQVEFTENCQLSIAQFGQVEQLRQGQVNVVTEAQAAAPPLLRTPGVEALVIVPLRVQDQLIGCLNLGAGEPQALPTESLDVAREIAAQVAIAIQQARLQSQVLQYTEDLEQRVADRVRELSVLYEVTRVLSEALDMETVLSRLLDRMLRAMECDEGAIHLVEAQGNRLQMAAQQGLPLDFVAQISSLPVEGSLMGQALQADGPLFLPDIATAAQPFPSFQPGLKSYLGVPMRARGWQSLGVLSLLRELERPPFSAEELALVSSIADQAGMVVESARLRSRAEQAAVMEERTRLARDLHDSVTQLLYSLNLFAEAGRQSYHEQAWTELDQTLAEIGTIAQQALKEMRSLIYELRPPALEQDGLVGALQHRLEAVEGRAGVKTRLLVPDRLGPLPRLVEEGLYYIAQEALNNILKHAQATRVILQLKTDGHQVELEVTDNGTGFRFDDEVNPGGLGLAGMRERTEKLKGSLTIQSKPGAGTSIKAAVPIKEMS